MSSNPEKKSLLNEIFIESRDSPKKLFPIMKSSEKIPTIIPFLNDNKIEIKEKIAILSLLISLFKENKNLIPFFIDKCTSDRSNLFEPLIKLYLSENISKEDLLIIEEIIKILIINVTTPKLSLEFIYQRLSKFFTKKGENDSNKEILKENNFIKYLKLLNFFYGEEVIQNDLENNQESKSHSNTLTNKTNKNKNNLIPNYKIKNYIYFNGKDSILNFKINKLSKNVNSDFPTLEYGFSFIFWMYIKKDLLENFFKNFPSNNINLVNLLVVGHYLKLVLKDLNLLQITLDEKEIGKIEISNSKFKFDNWNFICFYLTQRIRGKPPSIKLLINDKNDLLSITLPNDFPINEIINSISLFENFIGRVTSILFFSFCVDMKLINYLMINYPKGFFKNKYLFNFFYQNEREYFKDVQNYKYCNKYKKERSLKLLNTNFRNQNVKNLMVFFCPFTYNKKEKYIDDIFGHFLGILGIDDGVNFYEDHSKSIQQLGGINNLLPIAEMMYSCKSKSKNISYPLIDKNILTESTFYEYISVFKKILVNHHKNIKEAYKKNIFSKLGLFLEKFPSQVFTEKILDIFLEIGKEAFQFSFDNTNINNNENFLSSILLNEKILSKFNTQNQLKLFETLYQFFTSDYSQMKGSLNISKICLLIRFYDENRYNEYCCSYHANLFRPNNTNNNQKSIITVMNPEMNEKIGKLFDIIQLYIDKFDPDEEEVNLFKLLSLDLSPCIQKKIIKTYSLHFYSNVVSKDVKLKTVKNLVKNDFFDIFEYVLSISLLDIRIELLNLLDFLLKDFKNELTSKIPTYMKTIFDFIADNLLPDQLIIETTKNPKMDRLAKYFNKKEYEAQIDILWKYLKSMVFKNGGLVGDKTSKLEFNELYINFCIYFISNNSNINHINDFLLLIQDFFKMKNITNLYILFEKDFFYMWLIETIFYFNINENTKEAQKKDLYEKIKSNANTVLQELFLKSKDIKNKLNKIRFILNLSYKLKDMRNDNKSKINEIEFIARYLLKILLENENLNMDLITNVCYEFIIFFKDHDKYIGDKNSIIEVQNKRSQETPSLPKIENDNLILRNFTSALFSLKTEDFNIKENNNSNKNEDDDLLNIKIDYTELKKNEEVVPDCIYESLCYFGELNNKGKPNKPGPLYKIWKDFTFYEKIINYYNEEYWGLEKLCKEIKVESKKNTISDLYKKLINEYGENKSYKNKLYKEMLQLFNITDNIYKEEYSINILSINIQLLAIAYNLSKDNKDKEKVEKKIHHLIIYCIISSININANEKFYDIIQDKLYDILGFALLLIKKPNPNLYNDILDNLITPIFEQAENELNKKGFLKLLGIPKKNIYGNTSIYKLFNYLGKTGGDEKINLRASAAYFKSMTLNPSNVKNKTEQESEEKNSNQNISNNGLLVYKGDDTRLLKHSFQYSLIYYRNIRLKTKIEDLKILYKYENSSNDLENATIIKNTKERKRINKSLKKLIPFLESQIKKYSNTSFLSEKKRRNNYKSTKRMLFSWCGFWSNKYLFYDHPEMLKLKKMNHLTNDMAQLLMEPILDIEYYLPNFKKFDKNKLFNKNNYNYQIYLDIDDILLDQSQIKSNNAIDKGNKENSFEPKKNENGFNYLECIYKYSYNELWEKYKSYYDQKLNIENMGLISKASYDILVSNKEISKNIENIRVENIYYCCMVKITHHIRGYVSTEKNRIIFIYESEEYHTKSEIENDPGYDKDMGSCFGSIFKGHQKDKDIINLEIKYNDIKYMFIKTYFYNVSAIEIYSKSNKSFLFNFKNNKDLTQFTNDILSHAYFREIKIDEISNKIIGYEKVYSSENKKINYYINTKYEEWRNYSISTFELLMWLNIFSGRSFNDLTQYPIFPWILTNYSTDEINEETDIRDLSFPMGMLEINEKSEARKETFNEIYESVKNDLNEIDAEFNYQEYLKRGEEYYDTYLQNKLKMKNEGNADVTYVQPNQLPYFYGTHYSNPTYISHYLTRIFPYSLIAIEIQGEKFDDPDRLFTSMKKTFDSATSLKDDVRELIPEFYSLPEMLININNLNLSQDKLNAENKIEEINDVELPPWAMNFAYNFMVQLRKSLESENIKINNWLDLIFGYKQKGEKAEEAHNLYSGNSYIGNVKIDSFNDSDTRNALMRLVEVGMTPLKLFNIECKPRIEKNLLLSQSQIYSKNKGVFLYESSKINIKYIKSAKYKRICDHFYYNTNSSNNKDYKMNIYPKIAKIIYTNNDFIKLITNTNLYYSLNITKLDEKLPSEESELCEIENQSSKFSPSYLISGIHTPIIVYSNNKFMLKGGFWDGRVEINSITPEEKVSDCFFPNEDDPVVVMEMSKNEKYLLCGTKKGFIIVYSVNKNNFKIIDKLFYHNEEITSISINDNLNMFASSSKDGCINLYILPSFKLVRTIHLSMNKLNQNYQNKDKENEFIFGNKIFLSSMPIPCISIFISSEKLFKTYSINGVPLFENNESGNSISIKSYMIIHDFNFQEILIYGTNNGFIKIRKFPDMSLVNTIEFLDGQPIDTFALSQDYRFCYTYSGGDNIAIVSDEDVCINVDNKIT